MSGPKRTEFAIRALNLAQTFNQAMANERINGPVKYRVELSAPDGESTGGGVQALQHIKLVPEGGGVTLVAGSTNQVESWAELRRFEHLQALHAQRFKGAEIPLNRVQYTQLFDNLRGFFAGMGLTVRTADMPPLVAEIPEKKLPIVPGSLVITLVLVAFAIAAALAWFVTHAHRR
jgi:hypothetical protein